MFPQRSSDAQMLARFVEKIDVSAMVCWGQETNCCADALFGQASARFRNGRCKIWGNSASEMRRQKRGLGCLATLCYGRALGMKDGKKGDTKT
jgi:hypothetical protein